MTTTPNQKKIRLDVMISSTSRDLPVHRKQAMDAARRMGMFPIVMEDITADPDKDAISISLEMVEDAEIYLGIFGMRYGYVPDDADRNPDKISITEMEYRRAIERGIPVLIYIMDDEHPPPKTDGLSAKEARELFKTFYEQKEENEKKLEAFKNELGEKHIVGFFKSPEELRTLIVQSLANQKLKQQAESLAGENSYIDVNDKSIVTPPDLFSAPLYAMPNEFFGRAAELRQFDTWATSDDSVMVVEAIGGMGKSAVTWEWVKRDAQEQQFEGRLWYSFYERGARMEDFVRHALAYVTQRHPEALKRMNYYTMVDDLVAELQRKRYLLVLDGLERVLVAYHRIDKAQVRDEDVEQNRRDCIDPKEGRFLLQLASISPSKFLISTRLMPTALEEYGDPINGVKRIQLAGLHPTDAYDLMLAQGVKEPQKRKQLDDFMRRFGYHGLLLRITAGRIKSHRQARGDFDKWYRLVAAILILKNK